MMRIVLLLIVTLTIGFFLASDIDSRKSENTVYPEELPGAFTGGFGEDTCHSCHFDYPLNPKEGSLSLNEFPKQYKPNKKYTFAIELTREQLGQGGFQLSSRFEDGTQAGTFEAGSERLSYTETKKNINVQYLQHSLKGSKVNNQTSIRWEVTWNAPDSGAGKAIFNISANAGNGDASAFGDYIYVREVQIPPNNN